MSHGDDTREVTLIVEPHKGEEPDPEWAYVEGEDGKKRVVYRYRFVPPFGVARFTMDRKRKTVRVKLQAAKDVTLHDLRIETDPNHQLRVVHCGPEAFVIENANTHVQVAYYSIFVKAGDAVLACDPMILNRP